MPWTLLAWKNAVFGQLLPTRPLLMVRAQDRSALTSVLSPKKDAVENKNRKDYATEKWEQEVRDSLTKKKSASNAKLSKADQHAVAVQMTKEAGVRKQIVDVQARLRRGVELVRSLVASNAEAMERDVGELAKMLLRSVFGVGSFLADKKAFDVFLVSPQL